jgi:hypothetical protein
MGDTDGEVIRHEQIWLGFSNFVKWGTIGVIILMLFLFFFVFYPMH